MPSLFDELFNDSNDSIVDPSKTGDTCKNCEYVSITQKPVGNNLFNCWCLKQKRPELIAKTDNRDNYPPVPDWCPKGDTT